MWFLGGCRTGSQHLRRLNTSCAVGNLLLPLQLQPLSLLVAVGAPLRLPLLPRCSRSRPPGNVVELVAGRVPSQSRPPPNLAASARGPEPGDPEMEEAVTGPGLGPCVPPRSPTMGTLVVPLAQSHGVWLALPSPSRWLLRTIRLDYAIQFARHPPKFRGIGFTSVRRVEIAVLLAWMG